MKEFSLDKSVEIFGRLDNPDFFQTTNLRIKSLTCSFSVCFWMKDRNEKDSERLREKGQFLILTIFLWESLGKFFGRLIHPDFLSNHNCG